MCMEVNEPATVLADKVAMKQMLRIFLEKCCKVYSCRGQNPFQPDGTAKGKRDTKKPAVLGQQVLKITISDTGIGIPAEALDKSLIDSIGWILPAAARRAL